MLEKILLQLIINLCELFRVGNKAQLKNMNFNLYFSVLSKDK